MDPKRGKIGGDHDGAKFFASNKGRSLFGANGVTEDGRLIKYDENN